VSVYVERASVDDPFALQIFGLQAEPFIASAQNGPFAIAVDEDQGLRAGSVVNDNKLRLDSFAGKGTAVKCGCVIVAQLAYVTGLQAPVLAGDHSGGNLSAGKHVGGVVLHLRAAFRIVRERDQSVRSIQPDADQVHLRRFRHIVTVNEL
jgi:hypothetical protein